jgi:PAS domain-containing protein
MASEPRRTWSSRLLYLGLLLFALLLALAVISIRREWNDRLGQSRAEAIFRLVQGRTAPRATETPGAMAWLNLELQRYRERIADPEKARLFGEVAERQDERRPPPVFAPFGRALAAGVALPTGGTERIELGPLLHGPVAAGGALRVQRLVRLDGRWLALTRRRSVDLGGAQDPGSGFPAALAQHLVTIAGEVRRILAEQPLPALPGSQPPTLVRLYALSEEGTLLSLPSPLARLDAEAARRAAETEAREIGKLPQLPTFVSNEFFFRFDFGDPREQISYSGLYLDLGGRGLVATLGIPWRGTAPDAQGDSGDTADRAGLRGVIAADLAFDVDWRSFARRIEAPMAAGVATLPPGGAPALPGWRELERSLGPAPEALRGAIEELTRRPAPPRDGIPYLLHGVVEGTGAVAAFQVADRTWLAVLFPRTRSHLPWLPLLLSAVMLILLLAGFELNRRRAESAQRKSERALQEKQNLLNTMQVPLLVVDPNTDAVVFRNQAAASLGVEVGRSIADLLPPDPRARAHYERMQVARPEPRRAYGLPLRVRGEEGMEERYAIVRSVAVTAPIEALEADERHRLGIFFLLDEDADLALFTERLEGTTRRDERRRLSALLTHGVDALARVLAHALEGPDAAAHRDLALWLAGYIDSRLRTTAWLLDHWDAAPPLPPDCTIEAAHARATLDRLQMTFALAARDLDLRTRLHWGNGVLAERPDPEAPIFTLQLDWPSAYAFSCPVRGGFGFFLTEILVNAMRHGRPGSTPTVRIALDRVRRELELAVDNAVAAPEPEGGGESYRGRRILERLALLFGWRDLAFRRRGEIFRASWRIAVSERRDPAGAD